MITSINEYRLILEIGEATISGYEYTISPSVYPNTLEAKFDADGILYTVIGWIKEDGNVNQLSIHFYTDQKDSEGETNQHNQYKVMTTVITILKEFLILRSDINQISVVSKDKENARNPNQRLSLYLAYVQKQLPNWSIKKLDDSHAILTKIPE